MARKITAALIIAMLVLTGTFAYAGLFPEANEVFDRDILPSISKAIDREPNSVLYSDGTMIEVYDDFTKEDYQSCNSYFTEYGCSVDGYETDNDTMTITLIEGETKFLFIYDYVANTASMKYSEEAVPEVVRTVSPTQKPTPEPTQIPEDYNDYSKDACYQFAVRHLKSIMRNPLSLQIHEYKTVKENRSYKFTFDFTGENGFGGSSRQTVVIIVNAESGKVIYCEEIKM